MKRLISIMLASVFAAMHLGAQSMSSLLVPTDVDETVLGGFSRDRYESSRVCASASLWAPETLGSKNASLKADLNFGKWSLSIGGTGKIDKAYAITSIDGHISGKFSPYDFNAYIGGGRRFFDGLFIGVRGKFCRGVLGERYAGITMCGDLTAEYAFKKGLLGISLCNAGPAINYGRGSSKLPMILKAGGYVAPFTFFKMSGEFDILPYSGDMMFTAGARCSLKYTFAQCGYHYAITGKAPVPSYAAAALGITVSGLEVSASVLFASEVLATTPMLSIAYNIPAHKKARR